MRTKHILLFSLCLTAFSSCNYLDFDETDGLVTEESVYAYFSTTKQVLTNVYSYLPQDFGVLDGAMRECGCDDAEFADESASVQDFNTGNWSATNVIDDSWSLYEGVRAANAFLEDLETADFSRFQYESNYSRWMTQLETFAPQARVLRATFFFELARRYGDIAMPTTVLTEDEDRVITKTAFEDVIDFIVQECDECSELLPTSYSSTTYDSEVGRVTSGYALALKSKALLYAASPLHNASGDVTKWEESAAAAWALMQTGLYELTGTEAANNPDSKEVVLAIRGGSTWDFELMNFPIRFTAGQRTTTLTGTFPSQNLVDAFETINGYEVTLEEDGFVTDDPDFDTSDPYSDRDPRFARAILADGMEFKSSTIDLTPSGADNILRSEGGTPTGYFLKKYTIESTNFEEGSEVTTTHAWIVYRYAETLLTYAESMFYATGSYEDGGTYGMTALEALNQVRANAGMPDKAPTSNDEFEEMLRNEWRVEFAFEDHRFWDVRRWQIGSDTQKQLDGVSITSSNGVKQYARTNVEYRVWRSCMELYPIPLEKILINSNLLPQNDGWD
ncbi:MAG: RagB/SusD family nutrient uptake outer membrane protein [Bacteroides sp.]|nr:RagB/SusD family nutrient uptake outer membrane protein [Bacteroides sp.]